MPRKTGKYKTFITEIRQQLARAFKDVTDAKNRIELLHYAGDLGTGEYKKQFERCESILFNLNPMGEWAAKQCKRFEEEPPPEPSNQVEGFKPEEMTGNGRLP